MIDTMYQESPADQKHINRHLSSNCFGDYYTRTGLDLKTRELLTFSMLLALGGCESQLKGHIRGNLQVGNGRENLDGRHYSIAALRGLPPDAQCNELPE